MGNSVEMTHSQGAMYAEPISCFIGYLWQIWMEHELMPFIKVTVEQCKHNKCECDKCYIRFMQDNKTYFN